MTHRCHYWHQQCSDNSNQANTAYSGPAIKYQRDHVSTNDHVSTRDAKTNASDIDTDKVCSAVDYRRHAYGDKRWAACGNHDTSTKANNWHIVDANAAGRHL